MTARDGWAATSGATPAEVRAALAARVQDALTATPAPMAIPDQAPGAIGTRGGHLVLRANMQPTRQVSVLLRETPEVSGGVGGWETVARPGRDPVAWWSGGIPYTLSASGVMDAANRPGWDDDPLMQRIECLYSMGRRPGGRPSPPAITLLGDAQDQHTRDGGEWVMTALTQGQRIYRRGQLASVEVTIELQSLVVAAPVTGGAVRRTRRTPTVRARRVVTTRAGDTLRGIAIRELGQQGAWAALIKANPSRLKGVTPDERLRAGLRLVMP